MKLVLLALSVVGIFFLYQLTLGKINGDYRSCWDLTQQRMAEIDKSSGSSCQRMASAYEDMFSCIEDIQNRGNVASFVYQASPTRGDTEAAVIEHNIECSGYKISAPKQKIFVSTVSKREN